ncbi:MAG: biotin--[acetyl-CoA-carboxylase] ligase [Polyangiaceae bacterium]
MSEPVDLRADAIEAALVRIGARLAGPVSVVAETGSTNEDARRAAAAGAAHGASFLADAQTAGRGRGSHTWHSPAGSNIYASIVLRPNVAAMEVAPITLAVGLAVARTVQRALDASASEGAHIGGGAAVRAATPGGGAHIGGGAAVRAGAGRVMLKWPNDVYVDGRKIAGVLVEGQLRGDRVASLVAGIGLNVRTTAFPDDLARTATSLAIAGVADLDRSRIAASMIAEVLSVVRVYEASRLADMIEEIRALDFLRDRHVEVNGHRGVACGVDDRGCLLVRSASGEITAVGSGEATIRG